MVTTLQGRRECLQSHTFTASPEPVCRIPLPCLVGVRDRPPAAWSCRATFWTKLPNDRNTLDVDRFLRSGVEERVRWTRLPGRESTFVNTSLDSFRKHSDKFWCNQEILFDLKHHSWVLAFIYCIALALTAHHSHNDFGDDDSTIKIVVVIIIIMWSRVNVKSTASVCLSHCSSGEAASAANAGSAIFTAKVCGWTQTCYNIHTTLICSLILILFNIREHGQ